MATLKRKNADGTWEYIQLFGKDLSKSLITKQSTPPTDATVGDMWLDTSADTYQGTVFEQLSETAVHLNKLAPEIDYTQAFQRALDSMDSVLGGVLVIPQGKSISFTTATITKQNVRIIGGGTLTGKIIINCTDDTACNVSIEGVRFNTTGIAIEVQKGRRFKVSKCVFENCDKAIYINPSASLPFHQIAMANISHNEFLEVNYALYIDKQASVADRTFQVNDFTFVDNTVNKAYITHVYAKEIDGIIISGNTFFFPSASTANTTKTYNIYIKNADWVVITDNNLFESGFESIYLDYVTHPVVSNNNIAWCGQRQPSSAILINYSGGTTLQSFIKISDNNISKATKHGIELSGISYGSADGNVIECQTTNYSYYYGATSLASISHYGTYINNADSTASLKLVIANTNLNVSESNRSKYVDKPRKDITDTSTTIDSEGLDQINLVQPSATTVTDILNGFNGKRITLFGFNSNTTIQYNSSKFVFRGGTDINIPNAGVLTLEYYSSKWYEISRSFPALAEPYVSLDITDTRTTIDATSVLNFNLIQSTATTVTAINGGVNGKIVTLQAFNGNTTIQYGVSTILLKGAVNVTIPNTGILTLRYYAGKWYEISRNF